MFAKTHAPLKASPASRMLLIGLILILVFVVTTGFLWIETAQVIAPPGLRLLTWFWSLFQF